MKLFFLASLAISFAKDCAAVSRSPEHRPEQTRHVHSQSNRVDSATTMDVDVAAHELIHERHRNHYSHQKHLRKVHHALSAFHESSQKSFRRSGGAVAGGATDAGSSTKSSSAKTSGTSSTPTAASSAPPSKKNVLLVIDVQNGYDSAFVARTTWPDGKVGLSHLNEEHTIANTSAYKAADFFSSKTKVAAPASLLAGLSMKITYNKGWNVGLDAASISSVTSRVNTELAKKKSDGTTPFYDFVVYTTDYLDPDAEGVFMLTPWGTENSKQVTAFVKYSEYLIITAGHANGTEVSEQIAPHPQCNQHGRGVVHTVGGIPTLCFRKQVDDAFSSDKSVMDVDDRGKTRTGAQLLSEMLAANNLGPSQARLYFTGVVTNRCVKSSLISACTLG